MPPLPPAPTQRTWRLRLGRLVILLAAIVGIVGVILLAQRIQGGRGKQRLFREAQELAKIKENPKQELALTFLRDYLAVYPEDPDALALRSKILMETARVPAQLQEVVRNDETLLRIDVQPDGERAQDARRRLIQAHLLLSEGRAENDQTYRVAEILSEDLEARDKKPNPEDIRQHALVLEKLSQGQAAGLDRAAKLYEKALSLDPGDVVSSERLTRLIYKGLKDRPRALKVVDRLLEANQSPKALMAAAVLREEAAAERVVAGAKDEALALRETASRNLDEAIKKAPNDATIRVVAAELALAKGRPDLARTQLDAVPEAKRDDLRYRTARGVVDIQQDRPDEAIDQWSKGLFLSGGSDLDLSSRLAFVMLKLGRVKDAEPLIEQAQRLKGTTTPQIRYLQALRLQALNKPTEAIAELERGRLKVTPELAPIYFELLGECRMALGDNAGALVEFRKALDADPKAVQPRLLRSQILGANDPEKAMDEIRSGLNEAGELPELLSVLARLELRRLQNLPSSQRSFATLEAILNRGKQTAPANPSLTMVRADALNLYGRPDEAAELLEKAVKLRPTDVNLWAARVEQYLGQGKPREALMVLDQAADPKAAGDRAVLRVLRAGILAGLERGAEARELLTRDIKSIGSDQRPRLWEKLALLEIARGATPEARKALTEWANLVPDDPRPWLQLLEFSLGEPGASAANSVKEAQAALSRIGGPAQIMGDAVAAIRDLPAPSETGKPVKFDPAKARTAEALVDKVDAQANQQRFALLLRSELLEREGRPDRAAEVLEKILATNGGPPLALPRLNRIYTALHRDADLERLRKTYPETARAQAEEFARRGETARAEALARQVAAGDPEGLNTRVWEANVLNRMGKTDEAAKSLGELVQRDPSALGPRLALMQFHLLQNRRDLAANDIRDMKAAGVKTDRPDFFYARCWQAVGDTNQADSDFAAAVIEYPTDDQVAREAVGYYLNTGRVSLAEPVLKAAIARDSKGNRWAALAVARIMAARRDLASWQAALKLVNAPSPTPDTPDERLTKALILARSPDAQGRVEAVKLLRDLLNSVPSDLLAAVLARDMLARLLLDDGEASEAVMLATENAGPSASSNALELQVSALLAANQPEKAQESCERLAKLAPDEFNAVRLRARILKALGKGGDAARLLVDLASRRMNQPDAEAVARAVVFLLLGDINDLAAAETVARSLRDHDPKTAGVLARVLTRRGKVQDASKLFLDTINKSDPRDVANIAREAIDVVTASRDPESLALGETVLDAARKRAPLADDVAALVGMVRHNQKRYDDEIKIYDKILERNPDDAGILNNSAWVLAVDLDRPAEALKRINRAIAKITQPQFLDTRGVILTRMGQGNEAIRDLEMSTRDRATPMSWAHLALAYKKAGKTEEYRRARERAKAAGLTPDTIDPDERAIVEPLIFGP